MNLAVPGRFRDRAEAGRLLAAAVRVRLPEPPDVVLGLPRGGVPVAAAVARVLDVPLDVLVVRKLGVPSHPEFGFGAIGEDGVRVLDRTTVRDTRITDGEISAVESRERAELNRRVDRYRRGREPVPLAGAAVLIVDDGLATGGTARAAIAVARARGARRVMLAVPVAPPEVADSLRAVADAVVVLNQPTEFHAVGVWYQDFTPTSDHQVIEALDSVLGPAPTPAGAGREPTRPETESIRVTRRQVRVLDGPDSLVGLLDVPEHPRGVVVFAHGSGSSRFSRRNQKVAHRLLRHGFATLLFDLLTEREARDRRRVFDIDLLARRLELAVATVAQDPRLTHTPVGLFGASTGAAAALRVAATGGLDIGAVVSRGGRPDLASDALREVRVPVLLIVGSADLPTIEANEAAAVQLGGPHRIEIVPGATHLFEEPGALDQVAVLAASWFGTHLCGTPDHVRVP